MSRQQLIQNLQNHTPFDHHEERMLVQCIRFANNYENCFDRNLGIGHFTAASWITCPGGNNVVLLHHKKIGKWLQPGGHFEPGETMYEACLREAREETGLENLDFVEDRLFDVDVHLIPELNGMPPHYHFDLRFHLMANPVEELVVSKESKEVKWVGLKEVPVFNPDQSVGRMVIKTSI
jgi:8-oxo-dGTP pyrophosphatase MutT (NUDIX family)